ncbi:hypothetical protein [Cohnella nanjingensis]|uniref:NRDE family protein n=1 Tax=Cohnella nanjingensis TaxID=1387779 RepID=A0A7X0VK75_9BACL|nr:hypothetical protein [Cohnella nanjingensis]MBB6675474.1 hypothetical protein [Cohnella nanjingensis]
MCTIGAVVCRDEADEWRVLGFKNSDSPPVGFWHGRTGSEGGYSSLAYGILPQTGVNAGVNEQGLLLISSYFGCTDPEDRGGKADSYWTGDLRGTVQAEALARCESADEALALMQERYASAEAITVGGSHILADRTGRLLAFEHLGRAAASQDASGQGWIARSNQAFGICEASQRQLSEPIRADRSLRLARAEEALKPIAGRRLEREAAIGALKSLLSSHRGESGEAPGSVCAHGVVLGRSNAALPHVTLSGLIWDATAGEMHYTLGRPCASDWHRIGFGAGGLRT